MFLSTNKNAKSLFHWRILDHHSSKLEFVWMENADRLNRNVICTVKTLKMIVSHLLRVGHDFFPQKQKKSGANIYWWIYLCVWHNPVFVFADTMLSGTHGIRLCWVSDPAFLFVWNLRVMIISMRFENRLSGKRRAPQENDNLQNLIEFDAHWLLSGCMIS